MLLRTLISVVFFTIYALSNCFGQQAMIANGHPELWNRRYNEVAFILSHNATSYDNPPTLINPVADQDAPIGQQLIDGIRAMKIPVHYDYDNYLVHYKGILELFKNDLTNKIQARLTYLETNISKKQSNVQLWQQKIDALNKTIQSKDKEWNALSKPQKALRAIMYATQKAALESAKNILIASKNTALQALNAARATFKADPVILALKTQQTIAQLLLKYIQRQPVSSRVPYACHGLAKRELYDNPQSFFTNLINKTPEKIKPFVGKIVTPLQHFVRNQLETLFGSREDVYHTTGIIPYPACLLDTTKIKFELVLRQLHAFLQEHPHEIITLHIEDFVRDNARIAQDFHQSGLINYVHTQSPQELWPTLGDMIKSNKRLVVFSSNDGDSNYPWLHSQEPFFPWSPRWDYTRADLQKDIISPQSVFRNPQALITTPGQAEPKNKLLQFNHHTTPGLAGRKSDAAIVNQRVILRNRAQKIAQMVNHIPNFIAVDYYSVPKKEAFAVQDELNGVGAYKNQPLWQLN